MEKSSNKLVDLSVTFAVEILNLVKYLKSQHELQVLRFVILPIISSEIYKSRRLPSFFGAFYSFPGEKVLSLEQKNFLCFKKRWKKRYFRKFMKTWPFSLTCNRLSLREFSELAQQGQPFFLPWKNMKPARASLHTASAVLH